MLDRSRSKILAVLLMAVFCLCGMIPASAESANYSLTVKFNTESGAVSGSEFKLYYALTPAGELTGEFADLKVEVGDLYSSEELNELAYTLASYAAGEEFKAEKTVTSDSAGKAGFQGLPAGIYLVSGTSAQIGKIMYTPKPVLVRIPGNSPEGETVCDVELEVKYDRMDIPDEPVSRTVKKVWEDNNDPNRPKSIKVELLENGKSCDQVELSEKNNWTYTWEELSPESDWQVTEKDVPDSYTVKITLDGSEFTITNKNDYTPPKDNSDVDGNNGNIGRPGGDEPKLPQTGQLWWPVPLLVLTGLTLLLVGMFVSPSLPSSASGDKNDQD